MNDDLDQQLNDELAEAEEILAEFVIEKMRQRAYWEAERLSKEKQGSATPQKSRC